MLTQVLQRTSARFVQGQKPESIHVRSGNPGYRVGLPLVVTKCREDGYALGSSLCVEFASSVAEGGLQSATVDGILPDGMCARSNDSVPAGDNPAAIGFGEDAIFGCTLDLTREELRNNCKDTVGQGFIDQLQILSFGRLGKRWTHIATFGNVPVGAQDVGDWIEVTPISKTTVPEFKELSSSCHDAVIGVDLEVLYSPFGDIHNPQAKIVSARASHHVGVLSFTKRNPNQPQSFQFMFTVSFVRLDNSGKDASQVPPRPRLPLALPHDLFYPFQLAGANPCKTPPTLAAFLVAFSFMFCASAANRQSALWC